MLCFGAYAEQITINWGVDNKSYTTTTCEIGGDVVLPVVSKRGYVFRGWKAEHFDRGTFANWTTVPNIVNGYASDSYGSQMPKKGDYIIISDASDYNTVKIYSVQVNSPSFHKNFTVTYQGVIHEYKNIEQGNQDFYILDGAIRITSTKNTWRYIAVQDIEYKNVVYHSGEVFVANNSWYYVDLTVNASLYSDKISGTWKFVYDGVWEQDGISGWKPVEQIIGE